MLRLFFLVVTTSAFMLAPPLAPQARLATHAPLTRLTDDVAMSASSHTRTLLRNVANVAAAIAIALATPGVAAAKGGGYGNSHSGSHTSSRFSSVRQSSSIPRSYSPRTTSSSYSPRTMSSGTRRSSRSSSRSSSGTYSRKHSYYRPSRTVHSEPVIYADPVVLVGGASYAYHRLTTCNEDDERFEGWLYGDELKGALYRDEPKGTSYRDELKETRQLIRSLRAEFERTDPLVSSIQAPESGKYVGETAEDDDGDQSVVAHLKFEKDGQLSGWGRDDVDGRYVMKEGRWSSTAEGTGGARVGWIEVYDDGFEVALRGQVRKSGGAILGMWASNRGVSGSVKLDLAQK